MSQTISSRRGFLKAAALAGALAAVGGCASLGGSKAKVVVIGGGYGGATLARYLTLWGGGKIDVSLVERNPSFISCPMSNLVIAGYRKIEDITVSYDGLKARGVRVIQGEVTGIDATARKVKLADGSELPYDRLVVSPGIEFMWNDVGGMATAAAQEAIPHAWKAGTQTLLLQKQLMAMKDGGVFAISIPRAPYRCPPGPYERACLVADYLKKNKPKSKVLILDANEDVVSKKGLFTKAWQGTYGGMIEYRNNNELKEVDVASRTAILEFDKVKADVLNVVPPQRAADIARTAGLINVNNRWCDIDWLTMESKAVPNVHVLGDATFPAPTMPKSGHMANQQAKLAAAALIDLFDGKAPNANPMLMNTCYSYVSEKQGIHVSSVHHYDAAKKTMLPVTGSGGVSVAASVIEGDFAAAWARNIWADSLS
ncbi:MAG: FAD-dependent oxidoreductase [Rhodocyclaceae bacterium]|nr:FAD-dependent oxidoreductase [Rhodocyclaceae bacterium]MBX3670223.1 FAD-dependent oxidoreductase [Rhodocyclaceae bacterium]